MEDLYNSKTLHCKHDKGCLCDAFKQSFKQIKYGVIVSSIFQVFKSLKAFLKGGKSQILKSFTKEYFEIIIFLYASTFAMRSVKCLLRRIRDQDDGINSFIAGSAAGCVGALILNKQYCYILLMFVSSRLAGALHKYLIRQKWLDIKNTKLHFFLMFCFANCVNAVGYFIEPDILKPDMFNLYNKMACLTPNQKIWHKSSFRYTLNTIKQNGYQVYDNYLQQKIDQYKI